MNRAPKGLSGGSSLDPARVPAHVAIIMDGNGRWARARGLSRIRGHLAGAESIREIVRAAGELGIGYLTLYAFSVENWKRPKREVSSLMALLKRFLAREEAELNRNNVRLRAIGRIAGLPSDVQGALRKACAATASNTGLTLILALNYGGRSEIVDAVRQLCARAARGELTAEEVGERPSPGASTPPASPTPTCSSARAGRCASATSSSGRYRTRRCTSPRSTGRTSEDRTSSERSSTTSGGSGDSAGCDPGVSPMFATRVVSAAVLIATGILSVWFSRGPAAIAAFGVAALMGVAAVQEYYGLLEARGMRVRSGYGSAAVVLYLAAVFADCALPASGGRMELAAAVALLLGLLLLETFGRDRAHALTGTAGAVTGFVYVAWLWSFIFRILYLPGVEGRWLLYALFLIVKGGDILAYLVGKTVGRHKLVPRLSRARHGRGRRRTSRAGSPGDSLRGAGSRAGSPPAPRSPSACSSAWWARRAIWWSRP